MIERIWEQEPMIDGIFSQTTMAAKVLNAGRMCANGSVKKSASAWAMMNLGMSHAVLLASLITIGAVASYDMYLTIKYAEYLNVYEQNPLARWLMGIDKGPVNSFQQVAAFVTAKFAGTLIVVTVIQIIASWKLFFGLTVALPLACMQICLAFYLTFGTY